jgi:hypothetical protein
MISISERVLKLRERIFVTFDDPASSGLARALSIVSLALIVASVIALICETLFTVTPDGCGACDAALCVDHSDPSNPQPDAWCIARCGDCEPRPRRVRRRFFFCFFSEAEARSST